MAHYSPLEVHLSGFKSFGKDVIFVDANQLPDRSTNLPLRMLHSMIREAVAPLISDQCLFTPNEYADEKFHAHITIAQSNLPYADFDQVMALCRSFEPILPNSFTGRQFQLVAFTSEDWAGSWRESLGWKLVREWTIQDDFNAENRALRLSPLQGVLRIQRVRCLGSACDLERSNPLSTSAP